MQPPIYFVGAGPGDPELITVKEKQLMEQADRIVYAGSLVAEVLMEYRKPDAAIHDAFGAPDQGSLKKSRLYDESFSHGFRNGRPPS